MENGDKFDISFAKDPEEIAELLLSLQDKGEFSFWHCVALNYLGSTEVCSVTLTEGNCSRTAHWSIEVQTADSEPLIIADVLSAVALAVKKSV